MIASQPILFVASSLLYFAGTACAQGTGLTVDLEYGIYTGVNNKTTGLTVWKGYGPIPLYPDPQVPSWTILTSHATESVMPLRQ